VKQTSYGSQVITNADAGYHGIRETEADQSSDKRNQKEELTQ
jgi:hypothetical protein